VTDTVPASVFWMSRQPMAAGEALKIKCATQEVPAKVHRIARRIDSSTLEVIDENASELQNNEIAELTVETKSPVAFETFYDVAELGRFVLVRGHDIVAGGIITQ
jgi:sulfate adenylyltransferase subunit 1 (EFTu-like GTPase family)